MAAQYPNAIKSFTNPTSGNNLNSPAHATQHADENDEITAIQTELGTVPKGSYGSVKARLDAMVIPSGMQVFTSSGTWTKPANVSKVFVKVWGGGGAGGGIATNQGSTVAAGGGGGGYSEGYVSVTGDVTVTVGAAGAANNAAAGDSGGTSSFAASGGTLSATGGAGGNGIVGGSGGTASGGTFNMSGQDGDSPGDTGDYSSGGGGGTFAFAGGKPVGRTTNSSNHNGATGTGYGTGGSGGANGTATSNHTSGGAGKAGLVIVYY